MTFDWVTARHECSIGQVFENLRLGVKADVDTRQELREKDSEFGFVHGFVFSGNANKFSVSRQGQTGRATVIFELRNDRIFVTDEKGDPITSATVTLNNQGLCRLLVGDEELEEWQFRKTSLEKLFYENEG